MGSTEERAPSAAVRTLSFRANAPLSPLSSAATTFAFRLSASAQKAFHGRESPEGLSARSAGEWQSISSRGKSPSSNASSPPPPLASTPTTPRSTVCSALRSRVARTAAAAPASAASSLSAATCAPFFTADSIAHTNLSAGAEMEGAHGTTPILKQATLASFSIDEDACLARISRLVSPPDASSAVCGSRPSGPEQQASAYSAARRASLASADASCTRPR
eukprot:6172614-Pleurochrysis_carterae.AAC.1